MPGNWRKSQLEFKGITVPCVEQQNKGGMRWKRIDGFGHMLDIEVHSYKMKRAFRHTAGYLRYWLEQEKTPSEFDEDGALIA